MAHEQPETIEWVGGRAILPDWVDEDGGYQPEILIWLELPSGLIVGTEIRDPRRARPSLGRVLRKAMRSPMVGPPRRPQRVRVAEAALAHSLRAVVGAKIEIVVAPTPEVDAAVRDLIAFNARDSELPRALADGRVSPEALERLFAAGELLYTAEPWRSAQDDQILRLDIPELGVAGACVSIVGALGENLGFLVFPSAAQYAGFRAAAERYAAGDDVDGFGASTLSLTFEEGGPELAHREPDGTLRMLVEDDVRIAAATAAALASFFSRHRAWFESASRTPISETFTGMSGLTVKLGAPALVPVLPPPRKVERREPTARERQRIVREFKARHYAEWLDIPVPALANRTPRAAARTRAGRAKLAALLSEIERGENELAEGERFDVTVLRRELGIDE